MLRTITILLSAFMILSCEKPEPKQYFIKIKGSESMYETFLALKMGFERTQDSIKVEIEGGGSRTGLKAIEDREAEIGLSSYAFNLDSLLGTGHGISEAIVAYDGIVVIRNTRNPISELNYQQINSIYSGDVSDWSQLGGTPGEIVPVIRDSNSGTQQFFTNFFQLTDLSDKAVVAKDNAEIVSAVQKNSNSLGFIGFAYITDRVRDVMLPASDSNVQFVDPSFRNIINGQYPLKRSLRIYYRENNDPAVKAFLDFIRSESGTEIIETYGLVSTARMN